MGSYSSFLYFFILLALCGCATPAANYSDLSFPTIPDYQSAANCLERGPSSTGVRCESIFVQLPVERLREAKKLRSGNIATNRIDLQALRDQRLRDLKLSLEQALEVLAPDPHSAQIDQIASFLTLVKPAWDAKAIRSALERPKPSFLEKLKQSIFKEANPSSFDDPYLFAKKIEKLDSPEQKLLLAEYAVRTQGKLLHSIKYLEELEAVNFIYEHLWQTSEGNLISFYTNSNISAETRLNLVKDEIALRESIGPDRRHPEFIQQFYNRISEEALPGHMHDAFKKMPTAPETEYLVQRLFRTRWGHDLLLTALAKTPLYKTNPPLWQLIISKTNPRADYYDTLLMGMIDAGDLDFALSELQQRSYGRYNRNGRDSKEIIVPYQALMAKMTSATGKEKVLQLWIRLGPEELKLYIGNDAYSSGRLYSVLSLNSKDSVTNDIVAEYIESLDLRSQLGKVVLQSPSLRKKILEWNPNFLDKPREDEIAVLRSADLKNSPDFFKSVIKNQESIDAVLQRVLTTALTKNHPPDLFLKAARPWAAFFKSIPVADRARVTLKYLDNNSGRPSDLAEAVAKLDAVDGVREAVVAYLIAYTKFPNNSFSQGQLNHMFDGDRLVQFFPMAKGVVLDGAIRTKFNIALKTSELSDKLELDWLKQKLDDNNVLEDIPQAFGFRPALSYSRLQKQLEEDLSGSVVAPPPRQIRGLIVQGHYERTGHTFMSEMHSARGRAQVENEAPEIRSLIEHSLRQGSLARQPLLMKQLFVKYWSLEANPGLIESFRQRAIRMAEADSRFWDLRVEIHNFPTVSTLARVKIYKDNLSSTSPLRNNAEEIFKELERFLSLSANAAGLKDIVENDLVVSDENKAKLNAIIDQQQKSGPLADLATVLKLRSELDAIKSRSASENREIERYRGNQILSDAGVALLNNWAQKLNSVPTNSRIEGFNLALESLNRDGFLSPSEAQSWSKVLQEITVDPRLFDLEKKQMLNQALKGIIDQVYFHVVDEFAFYDNNVFKTLRTDNQPSPVRFIDEVMRSGSVFALSKAVDVQGLEIATSYGIKHQIGNRSVKGLVDVYNPGEAVGVLRFNKIPMSLSSSDIAVFDRMPSESGAVAGFITVGVGARLSHLQLLAKSLKIPNIQVSKDFVNDLQAYDGKWVRLKAEANGKVTIEEAIAENRLGSNLTRIKLPVANHDVSTPISFAELKDSTQGHFAGPKGVTLAKLFRSELKVNTPDGIVLPFGFFDRYVDAIGLRPLLETLGQTRLSNRYLVGALTSQIALKIQNNPLPESMMKEVLSAVEALEKRTGNKIGYFFRSDTNVEDLPNFNGAGLNESVPNVQKDIPSMDQAIRKVWLSPFSEKSIYWRGQALGRKVVTVAEPSIVVMPTIQVKASGVLITKGGPNWKAGHGSLSANFGIGSVVEAGRPVEEYSFESGRPHRLSNSVSRTMPVAGPDGGLIHRYVEPGTQVLTFGQASMLNKLGQKIESVLGSEPHGWDIEWGIDANDQLIILQARPNM